MKREPGGLTPYLASLLRLGGPRCERDFLGHEHRSLLKGAPPASVAGGRVEHPDEPGPAPRGPDRQWPRLPGPNVLRLCRRAA